MSKRIRSLGTLPRPSYVSEFDSRVQIFEPPSGDDDSDVEQGVSRKRVKPDIADIEDLTTPTRSSPPKRVQTDKLKTQLAVSTSTLKKSQQNSPRKSKSPLKAKPVPQSLDKPHPAPPHWRETYDAIKFMRSGFIAPVDTMGCASAQTGETEPRNRRYASLVALMLSSQTKDEVMHAAVTKLRAAFGGSISLEAMLEADEQVISDAISKVGFWRKKTTYLKAVALKLRDEFGSDVPKTVDELCSLPGVGPKMAFLTLQIAWDINDGIGVDVHVHRITNLLGWHKPPTKTPEQTRLNLQSWLPKELHYEINTNFVGFGQVICLPVNPRCDMCDLSSKGLCPSARAVVTKGSKTRKEIVFVDRKEGMPVEGPKVEIVAEEEEKVESL